MHNAHCNRNGIPRIAVSHPHGNANSYNAAWALAEMDWLQSFRSGGVVPTRSLKVIGLLHRDFALRFSNRGCSFLKQEQVQSTFRWELLSKLGRNLKTNGPTSRTTWYDVLFCGHDWQVSRNLDREIDAVYAYEDGARLTFQAAKAKDIATVYELPAGYYRGVASELERAKSSLPEFGFEPKSEPTWKRTRKDAELDLADIVVVPCEWARNSLELSKVGVKPVVKIPYGTPAEETVPRDRKPTGRFTILFAGQVGMRKGVPFLMQAWKKLNLKDAVLLLAGSLNMDRQLLGQERIEYLGALPRIRLLQLMREVDLFVFPSLAEGFGLVIGEAMACGVPVLTTRNTGGPELIMDGIEGWCVPAHNIEALAERIEWASRNRDTLFEMGLRARQRAEAWTWADYRRKLTEELSNYLGTNVN